jgi:hypothetical protein
MQPGYQQPGHPQAQPYGAQNPYAQPAPSPHQPGYPQQPPGGYPAAQQWGPPVPGGPEGPPPGGRKNTTTGIAIAAALAVIAAVVVGAVVLSGGDDKENEATDPTLSSAPATPTPTMSSPGSTDPAVSGGSSDSPRGAPEAVNVQPVIPGWKVVKRGERNVAFDVPPDWTLDSEGITIGFEDKDGGPAVAMGAPAYYKHDWCTSGNSTADRAAVGSKGANGAKSVRNAAEVQAEAWAYWAYQEDGKGTFSKPFNSKAFSNAQGITGWQAQATASAIPKTTRCTADGAAYTVAWIDPTQSDPTKRLVVWVLYCDRGVADQLPEPTIEKIKSSIRLLKK